MQTGGNPLLNYANENFAFFVQDDWKVNPRLSLNLGLRYDVSTVSREKNGLLQNFDLSTLTVTPVGQNIYDADTNNWGPRGSVLHSIFLEIRKRFFAAVTEYFTIATFRRVLVRRR